MISGESAVEIGKIGLQNSLTMVQPRLIGPFHTTGSTSAQDRFIEGRAVIPGQNKLRRVELFNASPAMNLRQRIVTANNSSLRFLRMARIALAPSEPDYSPVSVSLKSTEEAIFYVNRGSAIIEVGASNFHLSEFDVLYVGLGETLTIHCSETLCDISEFRAIDCHTKYPEALVCHADIVGTEYVANVGTKRPMTQRTVYKLIDQNVEACRLLFGDTFMANTGGVGSYPPHFHGPDGPYGLGADAKEEIYHFRCASVLENDTPYVLQNCSRPGEDVNTYVHLFDDQAINVTPNFHDTIALPTVNFMFTWCLGSFTENVREWARIVTRPGFENEW